MFLRMKGGGCRPIRRISEIGYCAHWSGEMVPRRLLGDLR
jgi:hypothetical protein